jgi:hypothetical protein
MLPNPLNQKVSEGEQSKAGALSEAYVEAHSTEFVKSISNKGTVITLIYATQKRPTFRQSSFQRKSYPSGTAGDTNFVMGPSKWPTAKVVVPLCSYTLPATTRCASGNKNSEF